ncbi:hypothetical protein [Rhizobium sp. SG570]|uniref:hypothetical protein n=1 Tax=Rhizobium sp. SG570 TaxID=2587113 RepID=UPI0014482F3D|nr:hypothetical protein [Rhizobium sp. SG570]NKJ34098.1 putative coiled-coil protein SlyX [Rhizobium sp. SG570]
MPDIQDQTFPYELLVRFGTDGTPTGAHVQYLRRITLDGEIIKDDVLPAQPIDLAGFPTSPIMEDACRDALAKVASQTAQITALAGQLDSANADLAKAHSDLATVTGDVDQLRTELTNVQAAAGANETALQGQIFTLNDQLAAADATIKQLQATIAGMQPAG